jgi:2,3-bisphosphoglycerate-independent phosphoglycerate mutase
VLEAIGSDMDFADGDLAYRINFATCRWPEIIDRRVGRSLTSEEAHALADEVNRELVLPGASFELRATIEHRGALVIKPTDGVLSSDVTNTDPAYRREGTLGVALELFEPVVATAKALEDTDEARRAAELTNAFVEGAVRVLDASTVNAARRAAGKLPANLILTRDAGDHLPRLEPIRDRFGWAWGCFVEMPVERGISMALGMHAVDAPRLDPAGFGAAAEEAYAVWADLAAQALDGFQALYVHIKGPDIPAHDGRAEDKRDVIEAIDRAFFGEVIPRLDMGRTVVGVLADHATSCVRKAHTADPVPLLLAGGVITPDGSPSYGETTCAHGSLRQLRGVDVLPRVRETLR